MSTLVHHAPITIIVIICVTLSLTNGQLVLQQDGLTNSYSVATPSFQTSFTRIFGGGQPAAQPLQQQPQPQQQYFPQRQFLGQSQFQQLQQVQPAAALNDQQTLYSQTNDLGYYFNNNNQLLQRSQPIQQTNAQQPYYLQQSPVVQPQYQANNHILQLQQLQQMQQLQQQQQQAQQLQQNQVQQNTVDYRSQAQTQQYQQETNAEQPQSQNLLNVKYSPSVDVSSVKFSSTGLNYTF